MITKKEIGKKSRAAGNAFEKRVRLDLEKKSWIVDKWSNNVEFIDGKWPKNPKTIQGIYDEKPTDVCYRTRSGKLVPAKPKFIFNPKTKTRQMIGNSSGFPDFIAFGRKNKLPEALFNGMECERIIGVESKMNGVLDKEEKEKCNWLLKNDIFSKILIASKSKKRGVINYEEFKV